jgi:hypothetical protein
VGQAREEASFTALLAKLGRACPLASDDDEEEEGSGTARRLLPRCLHAVMDAASESPDDLLTLLAVLKEALAPPPMPSVDGTLVRPTYVEGDSVFGVFLRQLLLECNSMAFETLASYQEEVAAYVRGPRTRPLRAAAVGVAAAHPLPTAAAGAVSTQEEEEEEDEKEEEGREAPHPFWGFASSTDPHGSSDPAAGPSAPTAVVAAASGASPPPPHTASARQAQQYLQRRAVDLEGELGTQTFGEVEEEVERLLALHPELPRGQFLRFLNSSSHREFAGALDAAHRYFDYALRWYVCNGVRCARGWYIICIVRPFLVALPSSDSHLTPARTPTPTHPSTHIHNQCSGGPNATGKTSTSRNIVQYAALNLAALHHRFGHTALALATAQEAVRVAQQNADHVCVALALAWLYQLLARRGDAQVEGVLRRCVGRAADLKLRHVEGTAALALAAFQAAGGSGFHAGALSLPRHLGLLGADGSGGSSRPRAIWESLRMSVAAETAGLAPPPPPAAVPAAGGPPQPANLGCVCDGGLPTPLRHG